MNIKKVNDRDGGYFTHISFIFVESRKTAFEKFTLSLYFIQIIVDEFEIIKIKCNS